MRTRANNCPVCGKRVLVGQNFMGMWLVLCSEENCRVHAFGDSKENAVAKWNSGDYKFWGDA